MKTIRHIPTNIAHRVPNAEADRLCTTQPKTWAYVPKSEWKKQNRPPAVIEDK